MTEPNLVLVVEDNEANQLLARAVLEREGFEVRIASSALEAEDTIRERAPDVVLMDLQLPGEDGLSFARRLKADPSTSEIPVVALTAHAMTGDRELALDAGCAGYIAKPIDTRTFGFDVRRHLRERAAS
jgi:two-component system, cell cycle response regulator DivK